MPNIGMTVASTYAQVERNDISVTKYLPVGTSELKCIMLHEWIKVANVGVSVVMRLALSAVK